MIMWHGARMVAKWLVWYTTKTFWVDQPGTRCATRDLDEVPPEGWTEEMHKQARCGNCLAWDMIDNIVELYDLKPPKYRIAQGEEDDDDPR